MHAALGNRLHGGAHLSLRLLLLCGLLLLQVLCLLLLRDSGRPLSLGHRDEAMWEGGEGVKP
jgi:hypothetical protein